MADIIVALDLPGAREALRMVDRLGDAVVRYKVGSELFTRSGPSVVEALHGRGKRVFLDLKFHDIPHTVAGAVRAAADLEVELLTLHATGGTGMMTAALEAAGEDGPRLLGVTLLTSFSASDVEAVWAKELRSIREEVARVAGIAAEAGLHGVVASAAEAEVLKRRHGPDFLVVTPGIRPAGGVTGDQVRTATPAEAVRAGADYLVVGRPVIQSKDPAGVVESMRDEMAAEAPEVAG